MIRTAAAMLALGVAAAVVTAAQAGGRGSSQATTASSADDIKRQTILRLEDSRPQTAAEINALIGYARGSDDGSMLPAIE